MSTPPRVSVLIPTFDRPHFLEEAITSVLAQTVSDFEVIVGDDGCDGAGVVEAIDDDRIRYQRNPARLGLSANWATLIDRSRGKFLLLLMDDDRLESEFLARCLREHENDPDLGVVFTNHSFVRDESLAIRRCDLAGGRHSRFAERFLKIRPVAISAALWNAEVWPSVRPLPDSAASDVVLFGRIAELGYPFFYIDEPLMRYRVHDAMYSSTRAFRDEAARAWESLSFTDPGAQCERDRLLADALWSLAAAEIGEGDLEAARTNVVRASGLDPSKGLRRTGLKIACSNVRLARIARIAAGARRAFRRVSARGSRPRASANRS